MRYFLTTTVIGAAFIALLLPSISLAQTHLIKNLAAGKKQTLVVYGTSLSAAEGGQAWVKAVSDAINNKYQQNLTVYNAARSAMWSTWGVQHLEDSVISKKPDAVLMEFSMNDAFLDYKTSVALARLNLNYMIDRIKLFNPKCEVILQVMNIPINVHAQQRPHLLQYYNMYRQVAKQRGLLLIDHYNNWKKILNRGTAEYLKYVPDGIHPDENGAREIVAPLVLKKLTGK
ncbi:SGNH/GDSL hydrolase family protein [Mucilaginibacter sp. 14171R-50]|uniref:SGNH/GDSL hydrolase family protein n=1 Tax=Mucilaginibacter sp. 14171R-50 TaxID=2703789 RepID=UPI00138B744D|nr:SGNH/GDSL hydrolase family protein [Mucilaginibacter sp. 14171R-50]QHS54324.1 SGNH/GDSL hydrolase family protein [Mucilaginibacter sp. 14171R-50]